MVALPLLNFIVNNFLEANIIQVAILHCWNVETRIALSEIVGTKLFYTQYVDIIKAAEEAAELDDYHPSYFQHSSSKLGIFFDFNCNNSEYLLNRSSTSRFFGEHYHWLIYDAEANMDRFREFFKNANMSVDADVTYAIPDNTTMTNLPNETSMYFVQYDVFNNGHNLGGKLNITIDRSIICNDSSCALRLYLSELYKRTKYRHRSTMKDITYRVSTIVTELPLSSPKERLQQHLRSIEEPQYDGIARFGFKLVLLLQEYLQFNLSYHWTDRWSGSEVFGGAIGAVATETADMASTPFLMTAARLRFCSVLIESGAFRSVCMFRSPRNTGIEAGVFLEPFSGTVWIIFAVILFVVALLLWAGFFVEQRLLHLYLWYVPSLLSTALIAFGSACFQGTHLVPRSTGGRMLLITLGLITFLMYNYYTSLVVSSLLGSPIKSNIKTLGQLADSSLNVGLQPIAFTFVYLNTSDRADVKRFVRRKISKRKPDKVWLPPEEGIKRVRDEPGFVYVFDAITGYGIVERLYKPHEICDLNEILLRPEQSLYTQLNKNSTYKEIIRLSQTRMLETGVILKHRRWWVRTKLNCFSNNLVIDVGLEYTAPLFFLLLCAYILAVLLLALEIGYNRYMDHKIPVEQF